MKPKITADSTERAEARLERIGELAGVFLELRRTYKWRASVQQAFNERSKGMSKRHRDALYHREYAKRMRGLNFKIGRLVGDLAEGLDDILGPVSNLEFEKREKVVTDLDEWIQVYS